MNAPPLSDTKANLDRLPLSEELLRYYKERVEQSEQELQSYIGALDAIKASHEEHHRLTWELQVRADEIAALQRALSDAQHALVDERKQLLRVLAENDELRIQELKDRRKIRYLLGLCGQQVPEDETTYFKPSVYRKLVRATDGKNNGPKAAAAHSSARSRSPSPGGRPGSVPPLHTTSGPAAATAAAEGVGVDPNAMGSEPGLTVRDETAVLRLHLQSQRAQLEELRVAHDQAISRLREDADVRNREEKARADADAARASELTDKLAQHQEFLRENTKEVLTIRKAYLMNERLLKEERVKLVDEVNTLRARYLDLRSKSDHIERAIEARVTKKNESLLHELRSQLSRYEKELRNSRSDSEEREAASKKKIEVLQHKVDSLKNDYRSLKKRRDYEIEGFTNDILLLRRQVKELEKHIIKSAPLQDAEMEVLRLTEQTATRAAKIQREVVGLKQKVHGLERDLYSIPI
ncbi:hypothetical protein BC828DRAFT_367638 [Blastocladiella britannica]|nr:hypothetical protein BC828DRAFT_367638 [Blastocladiella britannica]